MLNPNPDNSQRLENSSLTHRWEIPGHLSSIKQTAEIEAYTNRIPAKSLLLLMIESSGFLYKYQQNQKSLVTQYNTMQSYH